MATEDSGISTDSRPEGATLLIIVVFLSLSFYNVIDLSCIILATFKRRSGLYFWSFVIATWSMALYSAGFLIKSVQPSVPGWAYITLVVVGWCGMVTGQSVVLYSRLHIVMRNQSRLRLVLAMIATNAVICHLPIIVLAYGANSADPAPFVVPYSIYERVQVTLFFLQEITISALYIHETIALMRVRRNGGMDSGGRSGGSSSRTRGQLMMHLVVVNLVIVVLDTTILALEYAGLYALQTAYKGFVYSVKLKLEFSILNRLVEMTQGHSSSARESEYARTRGGGGGGENMTGVQMEKMDGEKNGNIKEKKRMSMTAGGNGNGNNSNALGNNVFVRSGGASPDGSGAKINGASVVMTTEVTIQRDRLYLESDLEVDGESIDGRSGLTVDSGMEGNMGQMRAPSHSSQLHIVEPSPYS